MEAERVNAGSKRRAYATGNNSAPVYEKANGEGQTDYNTNLPLRADELVFKPDRALRAKLRKPSSISAGKLVATIFCCVPVIIEL
ncbi:MAG: hypothetical protein K2K04_00185, partial [Clostridia bacterium]|nr:hypothetical protein [Clostridia bacterium]